MKKSMNHCSKKTLLTILVGFCCLSVFLQALAFDASALKTTLAIREITGEERVKITKNIQVTLVTSEDEVERFPIVCFDVRDDGMIAIGTKKHLTSDCVIYVYKDDVFQYGYSLDLDSSFAIKWTDDFINVRSNRGSFIFALDPNGQVVKMWDDKRAEVNFDRWEKVVGEQTYFMRNDFENELFNVMGFIGTAYAQFCVTNAAGETTILYDVSARMLPRMTIAVVAFGSFAASAIISVIIQACRKRKQKKE